jgi:hypothetical protein
MPLKVELSALHAAASAAEEATSWILQPAMPITPSPKRTAIESFFIESNSICDRSDSDLATLAKSIPKT